MSDIKNKQEELRAYAARLREVKKKLVANKLEHAALHKEVQTLMNKKIPDLMAELEIKTVTFEGIGRLQSGPACYASIPASNRDKAYEWLRENGHEDLIAETVNSSTLKAFAMEMEKKGEGLPDDIFSVSFYTSVNVIKVPTDRAEQSDVESQNQTIEVNEL